MTTKDELQVTKERLETELLKDPRYAGLILNRKNEKGRDEIDKMRQEVLVSTAKVISMAADRLGSVETRGHENTATIIGGFTRELFKVEKALKAIEAKEDTKSYLELKELRKELKKLADKKVAAPVVNVAAPQVDITAPEPTVINETKFVQETKYQEKLVALVDKLIEIQKDQSKKISKIELTGKIRNDKASEAIPVVLTDKRGKKFQDIGDLQTFIAGGGGGGGVAGDNTDLDSGSGTDQHSVIAIGIPASGGHVIAGTTTNPLSVNIVSPGTAATSLGKAEDEVHTTGDTGVMMLGVRNDANGNLSGTDGDYTPPAVNTRGGVRTDGDWALFTGTMTAVNISGITQEVSGFRSFVLQLSGTWSAQVRIESSNDNVNWNQTAAIVTNMTAGTNSVVNFTTNGQWGGPVAGRYIRIRTNTYTSGTVTANLMMFAHSYSTLGTVGLNEVSGTEAHDAVDTGGPVKVGFQARTSNPAAVANADRVNACSDKLGKQTINLNFIRELVVQNRITLTSTTETTVLSAGAAGEFHDLTEIFIANDSATGVRVDFRDATAGTVILSVFAPAGGNAYVNTSGIPINQTTAANNWTAQLSAAVTSVHIFIQAGKNL